jgi:hypothetical protein
MRHVEVAINGTNMTCQKKPIPGGLGPGTSEKEYPAGTCPYYRQWPNQTEPICILFASQPGERKSLHFVKPGLARRLQECLAAEVREKVVRITITATEETCELKPASTNELEKVSGQPLKHDLTRVCRGYTEYRGGSTWCALMGTDKTQFLRRDQNGPTRRCPICRSRDIG